MHTYTGAQAHTQFTFIQSLFSTEVSLLRTKQWMAQELNCQDRDDVCRFIIMIMAFQNFCKLRSISILFYVCSQQELYYLLSYCPAKKKSQISYRQSVLVMSFYTALAWTKSQNEIACTTIIKSAIDLKCSLRWGCIFNVRHMAGRHIVWGSHLHRSYLFSLALFLQS